MILETKKKFRCLTAIGIVYMSIFSYSCSKDDKLQPDIPPENVSPFVLTQQLLDSATFVSEATDTLIIGDPFGAREPSAQNDFRSIFSTADKNQPLKAGHIIAIRAYTNKNGHRDKLLFVDVMVKRETGFNPDGNDFEYMRIMYDPLVDYNKHPNGLVPDINNTKVRGLGDNILSINCVSCHQRTDDFIFYDNKVLTK